MGIREAEIIIQNLKNKGIIFENGLSVKEYCDINRIFNIDFPPDLKLFLQIALPVSTGFVNWRAALNDKEERTHINKRLSWPLEGMLFDVENNLFWDEDWGIKPSSFEKQKEVVIRNYQKYPVLIPIYSHRYIPSYPHEEGNPIFSIYQMDIVYYGCDLLFYLYKEFHITIPKDFNPIQDPKYIVFWSKYVG
jgi:hypothetical protein